jgi:hypothetical protein
LAVVFYFFKHRPLAELITVSLEEVPATHKTNNFYLHPTPIFSQITTISWQVNICKDCLCSQLSRIQHALKCLKKQTSLSNNCEYHQDIVAGRQSCTHKMN